MFFLYHHYDMGRLAELQGALLDRRQRGHALEPDTILVPNHGVGRWLQMQLANADGIAANLQMPLLARFIWDLLPRVMPLRADSAQFERARLRWHLYGLLPGLAREEPRIARYLQTEPQGVQRLQLAEQLADVFDQYLIYRPQMLDGWRQGRIGEAGPADWQARVWRALSERLGERHRGRILHEFIRSDPGTLDWQAAQLPADLYCFGLGTLPPDYLRFLYALSRRINVHFLLPNPCAEYWGQISRQPLSLEHGADADEGALETDHQLLASLGRGTRDLLRLLYADELQEIIEPELGEALAYEPPGETRLLGRIQSDVIRMQARREHSDLTDDVSIQVHACHGPLREIQVLHDQLLDLLGRDPQLQARDIVVMMPDVSRYTAAIEAVFGAATGARFLPYSLADRSRERSHPIMHSFRQLLDLPLSRWTASEVLSLAGVPAVMRRFGLDEPQLDQLQAWLQSAGVRWGLDAEHRGRFGAAATSSYTWEFGLDRLLLGVMQSRSDELVDGVAPWTDLEGHASAGLGRLWQLLQCLRHWSELLLQPASAAAWQTRCNALIDELFLIGTDDPQEQFAIDELRQVIAELEDAAACLQDEPLGYAEIRELLLQALSQASERQPFLSGGITFCGMVPLRAVPFEVICILGLDDRAFPRQERNRDFNVLRQQPRLGDRDLRDDDRLLFLQALMAARQVFYLSYTGQDVGSGDTLPPSALLGEWLDFVHRHHFTAFDRQQFEQALICRQPMHPFSRRLFRRQPEHPRLFSFARSWHAASQAEALPRQPAPGFVDDSECPQDPETAIELAQLKAFLRHPARYLLRDRLQLRLETLDEGPADSEPLALHGLERWQLREALLEDARERDAGLLDEQLDSLWQARALLPPAPLDAPAFAAATKQVNQLLPLWQQWVAQAPAGICNIDLDIDGWQLQGQVENCWPDGPRRLRPGSLRAEHQLAAWVDLLACACAGHGQHLQLAGLYKGRLQHLGARIEPGQARRWLADLLQIYHQGQRQPLQLLPSLAQYYLQKLRKKGDRQQALDALLKHLGNSYQPPEELNDPYFRLIAGEPVDLGDADARARFCDLAERIYAPLHDHLQALA